jgi:hypothetical protein
MGTRAGRVALAGSAVAVVTLGAVLFSSTLASAQGSCLGAGATMVGTTGDDVLTGTDGDDVIVAQGGTDVVDGRAGNDRICLGEGEDGAMGGAGDDQIEGGPGDDTIAGDFLESTEPGRGNDDVAGGEGQDIVVGDVANSGGTAVGMGNDKTNGGEGHDLVVGDAFSNSLSAGAGEDDLDTGPGEDIGVGDALTGTPSAPAEPPSGAAAAAGQTSPEALGSASDAINSQTDTDMVVGDAAIFGPGSSNRGNLAVLAACSEKAARRIAAGLFWGLTNEEILEWIKRSKNGDRIRAEFQDDMQIGDCMGVGGNADGAAPDDLNSGTENDVAVGDNLATGTATGSQSGQETHQGGKGNDLLWGDNVDASIAFGIVTGGGIQVGSGVANTAEAAWFRQDRLPSLFGGPGSARVYTSYHDINMDTENRPPRGGQASRRQASSVSGGGEDDVRGGQGEDFLEGGRKRDKCSGGPQKDTFVKSGPNKCEKITGDP